MNSSVFLIGMPGSGKSYWARQLASELHCTLIDLDGRLVLSSGKSIARLFDEGEANFREKEAKILDETIRNQKGNFVMATGGGTPVFFDNLALMKKSGLVIFLDTETDEIIRRLVQDAEERPLLSGNRETLSKKLESLWLERKSWYEQAHIRVKTKDLSLHQFIEIIKNNNV